jgi:hypothetical protein
MQLILEISYLAKVNVLVGLFPSISHDVLSVDCARFIKSHAQWIYCPCVLPTIPIASSSIFLSFSCFIILFPSQYFCSFGVFIPFKFRYAIHMTSQCCNEQQCLFL